MLIRNALASRSEKMADSSWPGTILSDVQEACPAVSNPTFSSFVVVHGPGVESQLPLRDAATTMIIVVLAETFLRLAVSTPHGGWRYGAPSCTCNANMPIDQ